jgi:hypothetical protein
MEHAVELASMAFLGPPSSAYPADPEKFVFVRVAGGYSPKYVSNMLQLQHILTTGAVTGFTESVLRAMTIMWFMWGSEDLHEIDQLAAVIIIWYTKMWTFNIFSIIE